MTGVTSRARPALEAEVAAGGLKKKATVGATLQAVLAAPCNAGGCLYAQVRSACRAANVPPRPACKSCAAKLPSLTSADCTALLLAGPPLTR